METDKSVGAKVDDDAVVETVQAALDKLEPRLAKVLRAHYLEANAAALQSDHLREEALRALYSPIACSSAR